jgi:predicted AlkP superfamily phosphohydrolase/phosphomutase
MNGLYVNVRGREREGIVDPEQADALLREIRQKLLEVRDPKANSEDDAHVITRTDLASEVYQGPYARSGPDALVGYNRGYRAGWKTILGAFPADVLEDNTNAWSGDHCMDFTKVPGVLLSNRKIDAQTPALTDIAPTILAEFGIAKAKEMKGQSVFQPR